MIHALSSQKWGAMLLAGGSMAWKIKNTGRLQLCNAICTHTNAEPLIHHKTNDYYLGTHKLQITLM